MDLLNSENLDTNVSGMFSNMYGRKRYSNRDAKFQPFVMYRNADGEVVLSSEPIMVAPAESTITTSPTRSSTVDSSTITLAPIDTSTTTLDPRSSTTSETITLTPTATLDPRSSTTSETITLAPIETAPLETRSSTIETAPTYNLGSPIPIIETAPLETRSSTIENAPTYNLGSPIPIQPIIVNTTPVAPTSFPVSTSAIPRPSGMPMGGGGGGGVAPKPATKEAPKETAKMEDTTKSGMSNGAKLAIVGLLAIGGYFAWKYRDMIFKK